MAKISEFPDLDFLAGQSPEEILAAMLGNVPDNMDKSEGGFVYDMLYPWSIEKAQAAEFMIPEALAAMFPMWARGVMLDMHGANRGLTRKSAVAATGTVTITGTASTVIPSGTLVTTTADSDVAVTAFLINSEVVIGSSGTIDATVTAINAGADGNVAAGRINRFDSPITGVAAVTNAAATSGGSDTESDDDFRERLVEYDNDLGRGFVGSISDYKRWALSVTGVGGCTVVAPTDSSGVIKLIVTDREGAPASDVLIDAVNDYIMRPDDPQNRLAPVNARISVVAPTNMVISVSATVEIDSTTTVDEIKAALIAALKSYYIMAIEEGEIKYTRVGSILSRLKGVADYSALTVNAGTANITLTAEQLPVTGDEDVTLTEG